MHAHTHKTLLHHDQHYWSRLLSMPQTHFANDFSLRRPSSASLNKWVCVQLIRSSSVCSTEKSACVYDIVSSEMANCAHFYRLDTGFQLLETLIKAMPCCAHVIHNIRNANFQKVLTLMSVRVSQPVLSSLPMMPKTNRLGTMNSTTNTDFDHSYHFGSMNHFKTILIMLFTDACPIERILFACDRVANHGKIVWVQPTLPKMCLFFPKIMPWTEYILNKYHRWNHDFRDRIYNVRMNVYNVRMNKIQELFLLCVNVSISNFRRFLTRFQIQIKN